MRSLAAWMALVGLAVVAVSTGDVTLGLAVGALKAGVVGSEYMELRHADRAHGLAMAGAIAVLTLVLVAMTP